YPVEPRQLFALLAAARVVADWHFVDSIAEAQHPCRDLRLDVEAIAAQIQPPNQVRPQGLEPGLHVLDVAIEEHVRGRGYQPVSEHEPVGVGGMAGKAAHSVDDVGPPLQDGSDHRRVFDGVDSRSASWMTTIGACRASMAVRMAAPLPRF